MTQQRPVGGPAVAISVSESPDMRVLGLSDGHLRDAMAEIALHLLASGTSLAYGGDLRTNGFTRLLLSVLERYGDHPRHHGRIAVTDYLAWPVHVRMTLEELRAFEDGHTPSAQLIFLALDGTQLERQERQALRAHEPSAEEWVCGLTNMRIVMRDKTRSRIVLGGPVEGYRGRMPGIAEETLLSLQAGRPVFLLGGFGGCARDIAETLGIADPWTGSGREWNGRQIFRTYSPENLCNGLSGDENCVLATTPHIQQAMTLVYRGLRRVLI